MTEVVYCVPMPHHRTGVVTPASRDGLVIVGPYADMRAAFPQRYTVAAYRGPLGPTLPVAEWLGADAARVLGHG